MTLRWPVGWPRATRGERKRSRYDVSFTHAAGDLTDELRRLGARDIEVSTDMPTRRDGMPMATAREPEDPGIAVYWTGRDGKACVMACDVWRTARENLRAVGLAVAALRQLERCGASTIMERAFAGFAALPASTARPWRAVLELDAAASHSLADAEAAYKRLARVRHPDTPRGSHEAMLDLNRALEEARRELGR